MKNLIKSLSVITMCVMIFVSCNQENILTEIITNETEQSFDGVAETTTFGDEKMVQPVLEETVETEVEIVDKVEVEETEIVEVAENEVPKILVDHTRESPKEVSLEDMVMIDELSLYVDKYELSIGKYCEEFPEDRDKLLDIVRELNDGWGLYAPVDNYPAILTYDETIAYVERVGKRLPTSDEWEFIAKGNGHRGKGNVLPSDWFCLIAEAQLRHVNESNTPNGYGVYEMMGNMDEWCQSYKQYRITRGVYFKQCTDLIRDWYPSYVVHHKEGGSAVRLVFDVK